MLSSRYAPVVALTALAIIILAALGWFLAIKPQLDERGSIATTADEVRANIELIEGASAGIDSYAAALEEVTDYSESIALNAPSTLDLQVVRSRIDGAIESSGVEIVAVEHDATEEIEGWEMPTSSLESSRVAALFEAGPVHPEVEAEVFTPAVTVATEEQATTTILGVPISVQVAGSTQEVLDLLAILEDPEQQLFQIHSVELQGRPETSSSIAGVSDPVEGDAVMTFSGFFYLHNAVVGFSDEVGFDGNSIGGATPFEPIEGGEEQPGAN